jgi:hypothetical protein
MSVRSLPRPVRTRKKKFSTFAPRSFARSIIAGTSPTFQSVTDMCSEKSRPASVSTAWRASRRPTTRQVPKASCFTRSVESRLIDAPRTPCSRISRASFSRSSTPFVPSTVVKPLPVAYPATSKISRRSSGSPPVRIRNTFGLTRAISSITRRHSSVLSSPRVSAPACADI